VAGGEGEIIDTVHKFTLLFVLLVWRTAECAGSVIRVKTIWANTALILILSKLGIMLFVKTSLVKMYIAVSITGELISP
jgi:hypothetical protein